MADCSERADLFLVSHGFAASRAQAQAAIRAGRVEADDKKIRKVAQPLSNSMSIHYQPAHPFVSRGGVKLAAALNRFEFSPEARVCLDVGASRGGFTQVLLERGAARVYAVDVGHGQLHAKIACEPRVVSLEGVNARNLAKETIAERVGAIVVDVSFISLKLVLAPIFALASVDCWAVLLVKPQFELGRRGASRSGVVKNDEAREQALAEVAAAVKGQGWRVDGSIESPIAGGEGNREYLLAAVRVP
jgi:23S rRNA (cytidine1920-2'-O)/16S rRNA (cytidine1409-2'-O)-methyltransferase